VLAQLREQLFKPMAKRPLPHQTPPSMQSPLRGTGELGLRVVQTVVEKRATFVCTPGLQRPPMAIGPRWWACGDYVAGPYPATLEGAVRSGREVIDQIAQTREGQRRL